MFLFDVAEFGKINLVKRLVPIRRANKVFMAHRYINPRKGLQTLSDIKNIDKLFMQNFKGKNFPPLQEFLKRAPTLTPTETKAFVIYMFGDYRALTKQLRDGNVDSTMQSLSKIINNSLPKLPVLPKNFNRSGRLVRFGIGSDNVKIGDVMKTNSVTSTSMYDDQVPFPLARIYRNSDTVYLIKPHKKSSARIIEDIRNDLSTDEKETLFPMETKFKVTDIFYDEPYDELLAENISNPNWKFDKPTPEKLKKEMIDAYDLEKRHLKKIVFMEEVK